jgi:hypothetical protein
MRPLPPRGLVVERRNNVVRRGRVNTVQLDTGLVDDAGGQDTPGGGSQPPTVPLPDLYQIAQDYADAHPVEFANACPYGAGTWDFLDGVVAALRAVDLRVGYCWRPERNNFGADVIAYYHGALPPVEDSNDVYVVDLIHDACGPTAEVTWNDVSSPAIVRAWREVRT